jgi:hypothetical protein
VKSKNSPAATPPDPQGNAGKGKEGQRRGREVEGRERMGWGRKGRGREREGRGGEEREGEDREMLRTGIGGDVCVMVFGGMDAPVPSSSFAVVGIIQTADLSDTIFI